jgi:L-threonylcarbamoyladenylate synthase
LEKVVGSVGVRGDASESADAEIPRVPGDRTLHYAPLTPLEIVPIEELERRAGEITARREKVAVLALRPPLQTQRHMTWINAGKKADTYAHNLYNHLRTLDRAGCAKILVQEVPDDERWVAIRDRLRRACGAGGEALEISAA